MMNLDDSTMSTQTSETKDFTPPQRSKKILKLLSWISFTLVSLLLFTLLKLPDDRMVGYIESSLSSALASHGLTIDAEESKLSLILGPEYTMDHVTLTSALPALTVKYDQLTVSPSLLPMIFGRWGGKAKLTQGQGHLRLSGSLHENQGSIHFSGEQLNLGTTGLLPLTIGIQANAVFDGEGKGEVDMNDFTTLDANLQAQLSQVSIDPQVIAGFHIPKLNISEAKFDIKSEKGKLLISSIKLGKLGQLSDDIQAQISGEVILGKKLDSSMLNLKVKFSLSENVLKSFVILDAILSSGKQPDGSYLFTLKGPLLSPIPTPGE